MLRFAVLASMLLVVPAAHAQSAGPQEGLGGPAVAGVCLLSREAIFANAKAGLAASARLSELTDIAQAEVDAQRAPIEADMRAFQEQAATLTQEERNQRQQALAVRSAQVQALAQQRSRELEATRARALERISAAAQPLIGQAYTRHQCGLLVDRNSVLGGNLANDLTAETVAALDGAMTTITFEREILAPAPSEAQVRP